MQIKGIPNVAIDNVAMEHGFAARFYAAFCRGKDLQKCGMREDGEPFPEWKDLPQVEKDRWQEVADFALNILLFGKDYSGPFPTDRTIWVKMAK